MAPHPKRSKAETAFVQLLLDVLRTVNDAISTATGPVSWSLADRGTGSRLLDAWPNMIRASLRPPPIALLEGGPTRMGEYRPYAYGNQRAIDRASLLHRDKESLPWGQIGMWHGERGALDNRPMRGYNTWGTLQ